jgi:hypothetical protein
VSSVTPPPEGPRRGLSGFWLIGTTVIIYAVSVLAGTGLVVGLFLPLLLTLIALQYDLRALAVLLALFAAVAFFVHRGEVQLWVELGALALGLTVLVPFGWGWFSLPSALWLTCAVQTAGVAVFAIGAWLVAGASPGEWVMANFDRSTELFLAQARKEAATPEARAAFAQLIGSLRAMVALTYPSLLVINFAVVDLINLQFLQPVLVAMQPGRQPYLFPRRWRLPDRLHWAVLVCAIGAMVDVLPIRVMAANGLVVLGFLYLLQGFGLLSHLLARGRVPVVLRTILYGILIISFQIYPLIALVGLVEGFFDMRRLRQSAGGA